MTETAASFDGITLEQLRATGGAKWSTFPDALGAFVAEMDFGTAPAVTQALHSAVDAGLFGYPPISLGAAMSAAYAQWAADRYGWQLDPVDVRPLADVLAGLTAAIEHFSTPGSPVILPTPAYMPFVSLPPALGRQVIEVPLARDGDGYVYDLDAIERAFVAGGNLLILCNPHNPTGHVLRTDQMRAIAELVDRYDGRVFADEIHAPLVYPDQAHVPYACLDPVTAGHTITATSASKAWNLPGLKCAQLILSNPGDARRWASVGQMAEHGASTLGLVANTAAYSAGAQWLGEVLIYLDGNRRTLATLLDKLIPDIAYSPPEGTYLAWLDCRALGLGDQPARFFLEQAGVALTDGTACGAAGAGFARLNFAMPRPLLEQAVEQMAGALTRPDRPGTARPQ